MEEFVYYGELFSIYKELLNESNKEYFSLYYEENLTLQEIGDLKKVSKSYVGNIINKTIKKLDMFENNLNLYEKNKTLENLLTYNNIEDIKNDIKKLIY